MQYTQTIPASGQLSMPMHGHLFLLMDTGTAASIAVTLTYGRKGDVPVATAKRGLRMYSPNDQFTNVKLEAAAGTVVTWFVSDIDIEISTTDGATVSVPGGVAITNTALNPVPVDLTAPVTLVATDVGVLSPGTLASFADVAIAAGVSGVVAAAAAVGVKQREVIIKNLAASAAAFRIGENAVTATRGIELLPGEALSLETLAAVYAWNTGAVPQSISVITNTR